MNCRTCGYEIQPDWQHCPDCGSALRTLTPRTTVRVHRETPEKVEQNLIQNNYFSQHFHLSELFGKQSYAVDVFPTWLYVVCVLAIVVIPLWPSWIPAAVSGQLFLYAAYRTISSPPRSRINVGVLVILWAVMLFLFPPASL
jgi:hypothetical protein